jgi:hypothetical protein
MVTRGTAARGRTASESTARETGESSAHQIEQEASTASGTAQTTRAESEITPADIQDMLAEQRRLIQQLVEDQALMWAELQRERDDCQRHWSLIGPSTPQTASTKVFKMKDPAQFCGGADDLDRFLSQIKLLFESHGHHFPRGDPDRVLYAMGLLGSWKEHADEDQRKTQMTHPNQWAINLIKIESDCLRDWHLFETEIREMYGDRYQQLNAATRALREIAQGALDPNETVKAYSDRMRSNWAKAGWRVELEGSQRIFYDMVWAGLRPVIKARLKPFAGENGRFGSIRELFKKAQDVEIKPNRDRRAQQPAPTAEKSTSGGRDKKRPYAGRESAPAPQPSGSRDTPSRQSRSKLPPAPWVDQRTWEKRKDRGLCMRCGDSRHKTLMCTKYSRANRPSQTQDDRGRDDRQDREKRPRVTDGSLSHITHY